MRPFPEPQHARPDGQSFVAFVHQASSFPFAWHYHPECELTLIESGSGTRFVGDNISPFETGDLVLLGGRLPHTWASESLSRRPRSHRVIVVHFRLELFDARTPEFSPIVRLLEQARRGCVFCPAVAARVRSQLRTLPRLRGLEAWCQLARILDQLAGDRSMRPLASVGYAPALKEGAQRRLERAFAYVERHCTSELLSLADIARAAHLTPAAFSRFFRRLTGRTVVSHVNHVRIGRACRLLNETDRGIAEIAYACGFGTLANFNRRFLELKQMAPSEFRRRLEGGGGSYLSD